jgi:hypothetical protein
MSFAPLNVMLKSEFKGCFTECDEGNFFEFTQPESENDMVFGTDFNVMVWVDNANGYRFAKVLKTVAYVIVDEAADGSPVVEKWNIRNFKRYL